MSLSLLTSLFLSICIPQSAGATEYTISLQRGKTPPMCPEFDTKHSDGKTSVMLSTPLLPSLSGPLWSGVLASNRVLSMGQI